MISQQLPPPTPPPSSNSDGHMPAGVCVDSYPCFVSMVGTSKQASSILCPDLVLASMLLASLGRGLQIGDGLCISFGSDDPARGHARPNKWNPCIHPPETKGSQHTKKGAILGPLRTGSQLHKHRETWSYILGPLIFPQTPLNSSVFQWIRIQYQTLPKVLE